MNSFARRALVWPLRHTPLGLWPVRVLRGVSAGARWTLYPWTSYWRGTHEPALQETLMALGGGDIRGWSCWDIGAHFGLYSVGLARRVGPSGEVAAFEPNPLSFARLARHREMNGLSWLKLYRAAVSDHAGTSELYTYGNLGSTSTHLAYDGETRVSAAQPIEVAIVALDPLVASGELRSPQFVKVDVEGHGHHALAGMRDTLRSARPILIVAFHSPEEVSGVLSILDPLGYERTGIPAGSIEPASMIGRDFLFRPRG